MTAFVHLHGHSTYRLLDGACRVKNLARTAAAHGAPALALTDHGNLFGAIEFYKACRGEGVKPILGFEAYVAPKSRHERVRDPVAGWHLTLLARNLAGWKNLIKLSSAGYLNGFYYVPRIDRDLLAEHSEGLVVLSGCLSSETSYWLRRGDTERAREAAAFYNDVFGENYYFEVQRHGIEDQEKCLEGCVELAKHFGRPLVATNDFHYEQEDDAEAQELLVCINTGKTMQDENRMRMSSRELYFKSPEEMRTRFHDLSPACDATLEIAEKCNVELSFDEVHLPQFEVPDGKDLDGYFRELCEEGLSKRYGAEPAIEIRERFEHELEVIRRMGFQAYFLIVWDFIRHARDNDIPVGPGRGSAAGSVLAYSLEITDIDPLQYDLLFERFLNEARVSMPDIDIDFCRDQRENVIKYVQEKYGGKERVAQIVTFGTMAAKAVVRDVGRVLGVPLSEVDKIAKKIPGGPGVTLEAALEQDEDLRAIAEEVGTETARLFEFARKLEGNHRNCGTHAAGVVIADAPLTEYVPLYKNGDDVSTQFPMETIEQLGLLKMDFLGLKTLTLIDTAVRLIRARGSDVPDFRGTAFTKYDDKETYDLLCRGESYGVFQLESSGMRDLLRRLKPRTFEESLVLIALFRPGPLDSGMTEVYCNRKNGVEPVKYDHSSLETVLRSTYGVIVYQEQVMLIAHTVAGFSLNDADSLRKAMGKKRPELMAPFHEPFLDGCEERSAMPRDIAQGVWDKMATFARYGFNKSHSAAYSVVTYQTAWLKAHYPREFMAALLTVDSGNMDKVTYALEECRRMETPVLPPDVNRSGVDFVVEGEAIRFGLASVKGVGRPACGAILKGRTDGDVFGSVYDLAGRVDTRIANKLTFEALIKAGACGDLGGHRAQLVAALDTAMRAGAAEQADRRAGQMSLLGEALAEAPAPPLPDVAPWSEREKLAFEHDTTGRYWSGHPLAEHEDIVRVFGSHDTRQLRDCDEGTPIVFGGLVTGFQERVIRSGRNEGKRMARFFLEDGAGKVEAVMFSDAFARCREKLVDAAVLICTGDVDTSRDEVNVRIDNAYTPDEAPRKLAGSVQIDIDGLDTANLTDLRELFVRHKGDRPVVLTLRPEPGLKVAVRAEESIRVDPTPVFVREARDMVGEDCVKLLAAPPRRKERRRRGRSG